MALKHFNPITPGQRQLVIVDRSELSSRGQAGQVPDRKASSKKGGRSNTGRITVRFQGGGHKRSYRFIDFKRRKLPTLSVRLNVWNTIRTGHARLLRSFATLMVNSHISWLRSALLSVIRLLPVTPSM